MLCKLGAVALIGFMSYGCGSDPVSLKQAVSDRGKLFCRELFRCRATNPFPDTFLSVFGNDEATCNANFSDEGAVYETAEKSGTLTYSEAKYQICTNHFAQWLPMLTCDVFWTTKDPAPAPECDTEVTGNVADGGACVLDVECKAATSSCNGSQCQAEAVRSSGVPSWFRALRR